MWKVLCGLVLFAGSAEAQQVYESVSVPSAARRVEAAIPRAQAARKLIMLEFTSSWCGTCRTYDRFLNDTVAGVGKIMRDNFVIVPIVVREESPSLNDPEGEDMFVSYAHNRPTSLPFYAILDPSGNTLGTSNAMPDGSNIGYPTVESEIAAYDRLLAKAAPRITSAERLRISEFLRGMN